MPEPGSTAEPGPAGGRTGRPAPTRIGGRSGDVQSVGRALDVVEAVAGAGEIGLSELAAQLHLAVSTTHGLARTLARRQYLTAQRGRYRLGPALGAVASQWDPVFSLGSTIEPDAVALADATGFDVTLSVLIGRQVRVIGAAAPGGPVAVTPHRVTWAEPLRMATGRILVALLRRPEWPVIINDAGAAEPSWSHRRWIDELSGIARTGWAVKRAPHTRSIAAAAVPIWTHGDRAVAAIGCAAPAYLTSELTGPATAEALWSASRAASARLGCPILPLPRAHRRARSA